MPRRHDVDSGYEDAQKHGGHDPRPDREEQHAPLDILGGDCDVEDPHPGRQVHDHGDHRSPEARYAPADEIGVETSRRDVDVAEHLVVLAILVNRHGDAEEDRHDHQEKGLSHEEVGKQGSRRVPVCRHTEVSAMHSSLMIPNKFNSFIFWKDYINYFSIRI